jgi:hypothetical protein
MIVAMKDLWDYCIAEQKKNTKAGDRCRPLVQYIPKEIAITKMKADEYKLFMSSTKGLAPHDKTIRNRLIKRLHCWLQYTRVKYADKPDRMSLAFIMD